MKTIMLSVLMGFVITQTYSQETSTYSSSMIQQLELLGAASTEQDFQNLANSFERIANAEPDKWHPLYYAGLCYINKSFVSANTMNKDEFLDQAQIFINRAFEVCPEEPELLILQGLLYQGKIQVDPAGRGMTYSMKASEVFNKALKIEPENPRAYYLLGLNILYTPESFGGGPQSACPLLAKAIDKFHTFTPHNQLAPDWGEERALAAYNQYCGENHEK